MRILKFLTEEKKEMIIEEGGAKRHVTIRVKYNLLKRIILAAIISLGIPLEVSILSFYIWKELEK